MKFDRPRGLGTGLEGDLSEIPSVDMRVWNSLVAVCSFGPVLGRFGIGSRVKF